MVQGSPLGSLLDRGTQQPGKPTIAHTPAGESSLSWVSPRALFSRMSDSGVEFPVEEREQVLRTILSRHNARGPGSGSDLRLLRKSLNCTAPQSQSTQVPTVRAPRCA